MSTEAIAEGLKHTARRVEDPVAEERLRGLLTDSNANWRAIYAQIKPLLEDPAVFPRNFSTYAEIATRPHCNVRSSRAPELDRVAALRPELGRKNVEALAVCAVMTISMCGMTESVDRHK
jgi:hypothetical protein